MFLWWHIWVINVSWIFQGENTDWYIEWSLLTAPCTYTTPLNYFTAWLVITILETQCLPNQSNKFKTASAFKFRRNAVLIRSWGHRNTVHVYLFDFEIEIIAVQLKMQDDSFPTHNYHLSSDIDVHLAGLFILFTLWCSLKTI